MDTSFSSSLLGKSPFSPRSRQNISSKRVMPSSFRKSSRFSASGKSTQSVQIILSSPYNYVERFGQPLPVLITEALTFADRNTVVSARISKNGYAWVVCGRRLLIWQYRQSPVQYNTPQKKSALNQCFELQLPQSDLAHRAELVSVFIGDGSSTPACIAVSPEGVVRYWPAVLHEGVSVEQHVSLQGQECDSLTDVEGLGCILATTTCTVLLIQPQLASGRHALKCKTLKIPTGWLGGISKRMSSLIFGPISSEHAAETRLVRVLSIPTSTDLWTVYVLADHSLQKWHLTRHTPEELIFVAELNRLVRENFRATLWENNVSDQSEIDTWLLDIQWDKDNIIILAAAVNIPVSHRVHYAMICIPADSVQPPTAFKEFLLLKLTDLYREDTTDFLSYRFLLCGVHAYLYNQRYITVIKPHEEPDTLEFNTPQDFLLAGSVCVNTPIFFSKIHGLVAVAGTDMSTTDLNLSVTGRNTPNDASFNETLVVNNLSIYNMDPDEICQAYQDTLGQLKGAFIFFVKHQETAYKNILEDIFPSDTTKLPGIDSLLDKLVVMMCLDMLDDVPAGDPRWNKDVPTGLGSSYSMQVLHQLEDKQKALTLFIQFLKDSGLCNQLAASSVRGTTMATAYFIGELAEKVVAAIALKSQKSSPTLEKAIEKTIAGSDIEPENGLSCQDIFYRKVTQIHKGIKELFNHCEDVCHSDLDPSQVVEVVIEVNEIVEAILKAVLKYRHQNAHLFTPQESISAIAPDYLPWTSVGGEEGLADGLVQLQFLTYNYGIVLTNNDRQKNILFEHLVTVTDFILDGRKSHLESIKGTPSEKIIFKQYSADRQKYMKPFLKEKQWERAAQLAEKYLDFETLVVICESTDNQRRLDDYLERFNKEGFSEYVYNWFLKENKQGKLIDRCRRTTKTKTSQKLTNFLSDHPSLSWMQYIFDKKLEMAADTLEKLASQEADSITRQKTMYSLSKLAKLASPVTDDNFVDNINSRLEVITFQEEVPDYVLIQFGYDTTNLKVIPPKDLVNLYTCEEYKEAGELEFKKALDLLSFIDDEDLRHQLSLTIWRRALLRDSWNHSNLDSPVELLQHKLFFRLIDLILMLDGDVPSQVPSLDELLDDECMKELQGNNSFQFLLKAGYEHWLK